ncbi:MAG: hypothetical protein Q4F66_04225 [Clostridium sp.]|nr:hypothetical protein [Clostridium sp.]
MAYDNAELFKYIEKRARHNVRNKKFFRNTDVLQAAFGLSEEMAHEIFRDMMNMTSSMENSKDAVIDQYLKMLGNGYMLLSEQYELMGGDKLTAIKKEAKRREADFHKGSLIDILHDVYDVSENEMQETVMKFIKSIDSHDFSFKVNAESFYKFLESDMDELDRQYERFNL